jgi:hypothetical protein
MSNQQMSVLRHSLASLLVVAGVVSVVAGVLRFGEPGWIEETGVPAVGRIVNVEDGAVVVSYKVDQEEWIGTTSMENWDQFAVGQSVEVRALRNNPERFIIAGTAGSTGETLLLVLGGVLVVGIGISLMVPMLTKRAEVGYLSRVRWISGRRGGS